MLIEQIQKRDYVLNPLSSKCAQVPRAELAGRDHVSLDPAPQDFGGLPRATQIRTKDDLNRVLREPGRRLSRFFQSSFVQGYIQPTPQSLVISGTIQRSTSMPHQN